MGTGINTVAQCSIEARAAIQQADIVLMAVPEPLGRNWIQSLNANVRSLSDFYQPERPRLETYRMMVESILAEVRQGLRVVAVFYGHPGVFVHPSHESIARARAEGYAASMLPAVSAEDCLFADAGIDPATTGCAQYEATAFLFYRRHIDSSAALILWQIGVIADCTSTARQPHALGLALLTERLREFHSPAHQIMIYEAADMPLAKPRLEWLSLQALPTATVSAISTLFVPGISKPEVDRNVLARLGLSAADIGAA